MDTHPLAFSPVSSPRLDSALAVVPSSSSPSRRDGRSSTDIVTCQLEDDRKGYFDAEPSGGNTKSRTEDLIRPTGIPLASPDDLRSQETTSTDKLDKEFQDGEELILAQAEMELDMGLDVERPLLNQELQDTPKAIKRKRSASDELQAVPPDIADSKTAPPAADDQDDSWGYTEDVAYAASKFGGIGEYLRHKRMKLQIQNRAIAESRGSDQYPQIFKGLEIYINGYVRPSLETLRELIMLHGGTYIPYLDRKGMITHIIASNLTPSKFREFSKYKVVTPAWITDSVEKGTLLEWRNYKLVPKGGGEEKGMRGGMGRFLARASQVGTPKSAGKQREEKRPVEVSMDSDEDDIIPVPSPVKSRTPFKTITEPRPPEANENQIIPEADVPSPVAHVPTTPNKPTSLAPVFTKSPALPRGESPVEDAESLGYPPNAPPPTTDQKAFERAKAMGWYATRTENPDAKRLMQSAEWREQHTAANEGFLEGYYQNSRLHHLSNWKAELKILVAQAQSAAESTETVHSLAPGAKPVATEDLSFADTTLPKAQARTTTVIGQKRPPLSEGNRFIFHVDFDAFFVACGLATRPHLRGRPVVVCHSQGNQGSRSDDRNQDADERGKGSTSEIASCSYEARAKGVKNGMSLGQARRLCPEVQTMPYEFETYKKFSLAFYTILMAYADELQAVSIDEALVDVSKQVHALANSPPEFDVSASDQEAFSAINNLPLNTDSAIEETDGETASAVKGNPDWAKVLAEKIRADVRKATGCEVSVGIAQNILLARLATRRAKPAGSFHLVPEAVPEVMADLEVGDLPNFGWSTQQKIMDKFGTKKCGELLAKPKGVLQAVLGNKTGESLYNFIRGIDKRKLESHKERKSVSAEVNYGIRFISDAEVEKFLLDLSKEVSKRLKAIDRVGRQVTLKVMSRHPDAPLEAPKFMGHGVCDVVNKSAVLSNGKGGPTDDPLHIGNTVLGIYRGGNFTSTELRGIGIQVQKLEGNGETMAPVEGGQHRLDFAIKPAQERARASPPSAKNPKAVPSTIISVPSGESEPVEDDVVAIDICSPTAKPAEGGIFQKSESDTKRLSKFGRRGIKAQTTGPAILPPGPEQIDPEVWAILPPDDQKAYRQAWVNQGLKVPRAFLDLPMATTSRSLAPRLLFPDATRSAKGNQARERSTSVQADRKEGGEGVQIKSIKDSPQQRQARSITPAQAEVVDISGSSTPPRPREHTEAEIANLGLDPDVFFNLPGDVQAEVYREAAASRSTLDRLTRRGLSPRPGTTFRSPQKVAKEIVIPHAPIRPKMNGTSDVEHIMDMIREWMDRSYTMEPNPSEVKVIRKYLLRCVDVDTGGIGGIQDAIKVMGYWRRVCKRLWSKAQHGRPDPSTESSWKKVFQDLKEEINALVEARFGGPPVIS